MECTLFITFTSVGGSPSTKKCNPEKGAKLCSLVVSRGIDGGPQKKKKKDCSLISRLVLSVQRVSELVVGICPEKC